MNFERPTVSWILVVAQFVTMSCSHGAAERVYHTVDLAGDVRLEHPDAPGLERGTFDLRELTLIRFPDHVLVKATFGAPVRQLPVGERPQSARPSFLQTVDVYLDSRAGQGQVAALSGRGFHVPAPQAWDRVLVLAHSVQPPHPARIPARSLYGQGRTLVGVFPADAIPEDTRGFLAVVAATSRAHAEGIRPVTTQPGDCESWDSLRCTLEGTAPAVLDATTVVDSALLSLHYPAEEAPQGQRIPVVFQRGSLLTCAPVPASVAEGTLGTVTDEAGAPLGMVIVRSVTDGAASAEWLDGEERSGAAFVALGESSQ